eukprot:COSAG04_NODE_29941_length_265_cov_1.246988_1_plen_59_part_10
MVFKRQTGHLRVLGGNAGAILGDSNASECGTRDGGGEVPSVDCRIISADIKRGQLGTLP